MKVPYLYVNGKNFDDQYGGKIIQLIVSSIGVRVEFIRSVNGKLLDGSITYSFDEDIEIKFEEKEESDGNHKNS